MKWIAHHVPDALALVGLVLLALYLWSCIA